MPELFDGVRAPSTLGSFLRSFTWGNVLPAGEGEPGAAGGAGPPGAAAARRGRAGVRRRRLDAAAGLRARQAGRGVRPHQDLRQDGAGPGPERAGRDGQHAAGRAGDRRHPAARRQRVHSARGAASCSPRRSAPPGPPGAPGRHRGPDGLRLLQRGGLPGGPPRRGVLLGHRPAGPGGEGRDRRDTRGRLDADPLPARDLGRPAGPLGIRRRGRRDSVYRVRVEEGPGHHRPADPDYHWSTRQATPWRSRRPRR